MSTSDALLEACRQAPDDDAPRLVWADAVGGELGELVVLQCALARGGLAPEANGALRRRERELLAKHGDEWAGFEEPSTFRGFAVAPQVELRRGFVEMIDLDARTFAERGDEIFQRAPLLRMIFVRGLFLERSIEVPRPGDPLEGLRRLLAAPALSRLKGLCLHGIGFADGYDLEGCGDDAARLLAGSGVLAHLTALGIRQSDLTDAGLASLMASGVLERVEQLWLDGDQLGRDAILAALARAPRLTALALGTASLEELAPALPAVTVLRLQALDQGTDGTLAALGRSRAAGTIEMLELNNCGSRHAEGFSALPRLRELLLTGRRPLDLEGARDLAGAFPSLRRLRLHWSFERVPSDALLRLARAIGPQLEELDLSGIEYEPGVLEELRAHVAGDVITKRAPGIWAAMR